MTHHFRHFHFYDNETGILHAKRVATDLYSGQDGGDNDALVKFAMANAPPNHGYIEGLYDALSQRVDVTTKAVVSYQPPQPSADHEWHADANRWVVRMDVQDKAQARTAALAKIDELERKGIRACREAQLGIPGAQERLKALDYEIAGLRVEL